MEVLSELVLVFISSHCFENIKNTKSVLYIVRLLSQELERRVYPIIYIYKL